MSERVFDQVLSALSRDDAIDRGWEEVKDGRSRASARTIFNALYDLYWEGVRKEIQAAIFAYAEFDEHQPHPLPVETFIEKDFRSDKLAGLIELWNPLEFDDHSPTGIDNTTAYVNENVKEKVQNYFKYQSTEIIRAQSLLQAIGLMDIDFVREHRRPTFRSLGQRPQVKDKDDYLLMALQCSECRHCIRAFHYYECTDGCLDYPEQSNVFKIQPPQSDSSLHMDVHQMVLLEAIETSHYTICPPCFKSSTHPRSHLKVVRRFPSGQYEKSKSTAFSRELDAWEDHMDGKLLMSLGTLTLDRLASSGGSIFSRASSRNVFPAGNTHCAMMFGPLLIENGVTRYPGGACISHRNIPNFTVSSLRDLQEFLSEPHQYILRNGEEILSHKLISVSAGRRLYTSQSRLRDRQFLSTQKQLSGGLFTSHCGRFAQDEMEIVINFIQFAKMWREVKSDNMTQREYRNTLKSYAEELTSMIQKTFDIEIKKFLICFAERLHKKVKLQYNRLSNNCQEFCSAMIYNGDNWDQIFRGVYPSNRPQIWDDEKIELRYLMSFAGRLQHKEFLVSPLTSSLQLYNSFGHNDSDLIDHVTSIRTRDWLGSGNADIHDVYLVKNCSMTCNFQSGYSCSSLYFFLVAETYRCTLADHLLDGPHDNLSVLTSHIHRRKEIYSIIKEYDDGYDEILTNQGPLEWVKNRLEILRRLAMLNAYIASISDQFNALTLPMTAQDVLKVWHPPHSTFGRAWSCNRREGRDLAKPSWLDDIYLDKEGVTNQKYSLQFTTMHTSPDSLAKEAWTLRFDSVRNQLLGKAKPVFWNACNCDTCQQITMHLNCTRATRHAASLGHVESKDRIYSSTSPDFVPVDEMYASIDSLGISYKVVTDLLKQLVRTPEYLGYDQTTKLLTEKCPELYETYLSLASRLGGREPLEFLVWLGIKLDEG